jgi:CBS domain-containing protein
MPVADHCRHNPCTARPDESARVAARRMREANVGCLVVVDEESRPVGMLSDRELVLRVLRRRRDPDAVVVGDVMTTPVETVRDVSPMLRAIRCMRREGVRRLPVVDREGKLLGIVALDDALQLISSELEGLAQVARSQFPPDLEASHALHASQKGG